MLSARNDIAGPSCDQIQAEIVSKKPPFPLVMHISDRGLTVNYHHQICGETVSEGDSYRKVVCSFIVTLLFSSSEL